MSNATQYRKLGLQLRPAQSSRVAGWSRLISLLGDPSGDVPPRLFIHRRCRRLIETIPLLQHDPQHPEDVLKIDADENGIGGDDAADALRYLIAARPAGSAMGAAVA